MKIYVQKGQNVQQNNTKKYVFLSLAAIFLISAGVWFKFAGRTAIYDLRNSADATREGLKSAEDEQREQREAIDKAGNAANRSAESIKDSQRTATEIKRLERSDAEVITDGQRILQEVRNGSRTQDKS
ncbi:hypothetical protein [Dialister hominis]|uniref:hypothetical protein n=1 Tax=Dialister hominis TaxID=2582419 RepID=UPI003AB45BF0